MKYYQDLTLLPDAEANLVFLWQKVYQQVHIALVENSFLSDEKFRNKDNKLEPVKKSHIAVSFPSYNDKAYPLGNKLRLFAKSKEQLEQLSIAKWLNRLTDYCHYTSIKEVPSGVTQFAIFQQFRIKSNFIKKAQRRAKHLKKPLKEVIAYMQNEDEARGLSYSSNLPFIVTKSLSEQQSRHLFIKRNLVKQSSEGLFSCYGLSSNDKDKTATVPWFS